MKHAYSLKNANRVFLISILSLMFIAASSQTNFGGLGANDSGGSGFKTMANNANLVVSNDMLNDGTDMYTNTQGYVFTIKAYGVDDFTFNDMNFRYYTTNNTVHVDGNSTIVFKDKNGSPIQTMSLNDDKPLTNVSVSVTDFFDNGTTTPINNVAEIIVNIRDLAPPAPGYTRNYSYEDITISQSADCPVVSNDETFSSGFTTPTVAWNVGNSFTACQDGIISKINVLSVDAQTGVTMKVYEGNGVSGNLLQTITGIALSNASTIIDYTEIDVSSYNIPVTSGIQYTFYFSDPDSKVRIYFNTSNSMYEGGTYWVDDEGVQEAPDRDLYFEVEFTDAPAASTPTLSTQAVSNFTATSATMGGSVTNDGGAAVTERGVVYSPTDATPTIGEGSVTKDVNGSGTGSFSESISNLTPNTTYYVQAYATNSAGTSYGGVESFTTSFANLTWDGSTNSDWNTADNWDGGTIPTSAYNVTIPIVATSYPAISPGDNAICNNLTVAASASLTIESGGSLITNGTITNNGSITMQRAMDDGKWHLISMPCTGITANTFLGDYLQYWTEDGQSWADIVEPTSQELSIMQGYSLWGTAKGSYSFSGTPNTGSQSISLSYHENLDPEKTADGLNLVGNPYPSSIDWATLQPTYGTAYVWNPATSNYIYNTDADIAPIQGFFVYTTINGSSFALENANRSHGGSFYKNSSQLTHGIVLAASYKNHFDELKILFDNNAADGFNLIDDSWKLISSGAGVSQIWTYSPDGKLAIDKRPETELIQLGFANNEAGSYTIGIKEIADLNTAILEDSKLNIFHDLRQGDYSFTWSLNDAETRFKLHFNTTAVDEISSNMLQAYVSGNEIIIKSEVQADRIILTDITGRTLGVWENAEQIPAPETAGVYLVTVESENQQITKKIIIQ